MPRNLEARLCSVEARQKPADLSSAHMVHGSEETPDEAQARNLVQHPQDAARAIYTLNTGVPRARSFGARP